MKIEFDFSRLDRIPSFFSVIEGEDYLKTVSEWFAQIFDLGFAFYDRIGFLWLIVVGIFISVFARVVLFPIVGGRGFEFGPDRARSGENNYVSEKKKFYKDNRRAFSRFNSKDGE